MGALADEYVRVRADTSYLGRDLKKEGAKSGKSYGTAFGASFKSIIGIAAVFKALSAATTFLKDANAEAVESIKVGKETSRVLKTTGGAANVTAKQVSALATAISNKTGIDDEAVQSGANLLLTFTKVRNEAGKGNDIFNQATGVVQDMAVTFKQSGKSSAIQLGKALQDPIKGVGALARIGVQFTDQQKAQIKTMVESGNILGAQKIILGELKTQTAGAAAAQATATEKMATGWNNIKEAVGIGLRPVIDEFANFMSGRVFPVLMTAATWLGERIPGAIDRMKKIFATVKTAVAGFFASFKGGEAGATVDVLRGHLQTLVDFIRVNVLPVVRQFAQFFVTQVIPALRTVGQFILREVVPRFFAIQRAVLDLYAVVIPIIRQIVGAIVGQFMKMRPQIMSVWTSVKEIITGVMFIIREVITSVTNIIRMVWDRWGKQITAVVTTVFRGLVNIISGVMKAIAGIIKLVVALIKGDWSGAWNAIKQIFSGVWQAIRGILTVATAALRATLAAWWAKVKSLWTSAQTAVRSSWTGFWTGVRNTASTMIEAVRSRVVGVLGRIRDAFRTTVGNIKTIWNGVKNAVSAPVEWIKNNVYNKPLVPVWNRVASLVSGPKLSAYASGGVEGVRPGYTPGRDTHPIMVSGGEAIMRPEWTRVVGKDWINAANRAARRGVGAARNFVGMGDPKGLPGFAGGGVVGWIKGLASNVASKVGSLKDWALGGLRAAAGKVLDPVKALIGKAMPKSGVGTTVGGIGKKVIDLVLDKIHKEDVLPTPMGPAGSAIASGGWASIYRILRAVGARSFTTYAGHDQGASRSRDIWPASAGDRVAETARRISSIWYVIWKRRIASITTGRRWIGYHGSNPHTDHVHVTLRPGVKAAKGGIANFDNGGVFKPGLNLAYNGTGRDELLRPVRNGRVSGGAAAIAPRPITILIDLGDGLVQRVQGLIDENDEFRATVGRTR